MKKNFLLAIAVMLMTAVSSFAQNEQKEYNMVITLNNGTTVTLGHNDIKDITFNDGEISISGDVVSTIDYLIHFTEYLDERVYQDRDEQYSKIQDLEYRMAELAEYTKNNINAIVAMIEQLHPEIANSPKFKAVKAAAAAQTAKVAETVKAAKAAMKK